MKLELKKQQTQRNAFAKQHITKDIMVLKKNIVQMLPDNYST